MSSKLRWLQLASQEQLVVGVGVPSFTNYTSPSLILYRIDQLVDERTTLSSEQRPEPSLASQLVGTFDPATRLIQVTFLIGLLYVRDGRSLGIIGDFCIGSNTKELNLVHLGATRARNQMTDFLLDNFDQAVHVTIVAFCSWHDMCIRLT